jgi:hypothetical protein
MINRFCAGISESLFGYIQTTYAALIGVFGQPNFAMGKVRAEWVIESPYGRIIVGDWNDHDTPLPALTKWCVNAERDATNECWLIDDLAGALKWLSEEIPGSAAKMYKP